MGCLRGGLRRYSGVPNRVPVAGGEGGGRQPSLLLRGSGRPWVHLKDGDKDQARFRMRAVRGQSGWRGCGVGDAVDATLTFGPNGSVY